MRIYLQKNMENPWTILARGTYTSGIETFTINYSQLLTQKILETPFFSVNEDVSNSHMLFHSQITNIWKLHEDPDISLRGRSKKRQDSSTGFDPDPGGVPTHRGPILRPRAMEKCVDT